MLTCFPVGDISYLVAMMFTIGSALWVLYGFFVWVPTLRSEAPLSQETLDAGEFPCPIELC